MIVQTGILTSLPSELQKRFENSGAFEIVEELKVIFQAHARTERYGASEKFFNFKMKEGSSITEHVLKMISHANRLGPLGIHIPNELGVDRVL